MPSSISYPQNIVIVGGGSAGWMAAAFLVHGFAKHGTRITLIESSNIGTVGVGEGTVPLFKRFLQHLDISEQEFMSACNATFKLGINFPGWTNNEEFDTYFHPFHCAGYSQHNQRFFHNCNLRRNGQSASTDPGGFFFGAEMAEQRKAPTGPPPCDPDKVGYAYHFDAGLLADFLKKRSIGQGVVHIVDDVTEVVLKDDGDIDHLLTANSGELSADFFVDCTGFARKLIGAALNADVVSYKPRLFNDNAVVMRTPVPADSEVPPFTESRALKCGWAWRIPLVNRIGWGYVYSGDYTSNKDAETELRDLIGEEARDLPARHLKMQIGRVSEHWKNNCVAIGLSQGFIEPLEATALGLTQFSINMFARHYHKGEFQPTYRDYYNKIVNNAFDTTVDYIQMHYKLNTRDDTQYWRDCRANENISDTMRGVIAGWDRSSDDFNAVLKEHVKGSYPPYSWYCILSGMGRYAGGAERQSNDVANPYRDEVKRFYGHRQYLDSVNKS